MTFIGRAKTGRVFHIATGASGGYVWWLCGAATRNPDPLRIPLPVDAWFLGLEDGRMCGGCWRKHNARVEQMEDQQESRVSKLLGNAVDCLVAHDWRSAELLLDTVFRTNDLEPRRPR
jgi:hypothetical protein